MSAPSEDGSELVAFLRHEARTNLRAVVRYDDDGFEVLHLRDDVASRYQPAEIVDAVDRHREAERIEQRHEAGFHTGTHGATLRVFEEAVVVHVPRAERYGVIVSLDPTAATDCVSFVEKCVSYLRADERRNDGPRA